QFAYAGERLAGIVQDQRSGGEAERLARLDRRDALCRPRGGDQFGDQCELRLGRHQLSSCSTGRTARFARAREHLHRIEVAVRAGGQSEAEGFEPGSEQVLPVVRTVHPAFLKTLELVSVRRRTVAAGGDVFRYSSAAAAAG